MLVDDLLNIVICKLVLYMFHLLMANFEHKRLHLHSGRYPKCLLMLACCEGNKLFALQASINRHLGYLPLCKCSLLSIHSGRYPKCLLMLACCEGNKLFALQASINRHLGYLPLCKCSLLNTKGCIYTEADILSVC